MRNMSTKQSKFKPKLKLKQYKPTEIEPEIFKKWTEKGHYRFKFDTKKPIFSIDTPPPYTNAPWHMGGAIHYSGIDMIARTMRMKGYEVLFPMGLDRNGLPIEVQAEKENNVKMHETPRAEFLKMCEDILNRYGAKILDVCYALGFSCNSFEWDEVYKTDQPQYRALTQATFIELYKKGLIYLDDRPNNWCPGCRTTIADAEIEYQEGKTWLYDIEFTVKETGEPLIISTTRPELIPSIGIVIYHPKDERYKKWEGKTAVVPLFNIEVPIKAHPSVDPEFGTGIMMVCSFGDRTDVDLFREFKLTPRYSISIDGKLTENTGEFAGMSIKEGRKAIVKKLEELGKLRDKKEITHRYPICERSKDPIEFIGMQEFYLKQIEFVDTLKSYIDKIEWHPPYMKQIWIDWLNQINIDWPISRRRYYGTEVPVWYCNACGEINLPEPGPYYRPWRDDPPFDTCQHCRKKEGFTGDERTFDTWMDSSISPIYIMMHPHNKKNLEFFENAIKRGYVADIRPQGKDIVRTWFHYSMLRVQQLYNIPAFRHAWIGGHVVDKEGKKMSKSKGNIADPVEYIQKYGGDALRFYGMLEASHGSDIRFDPQRLDGVAKFLNKFYNIARFISMFPYLEDPNECQFLPTDYWIMHELRLALQKAFDGYDKLDFHFPARALRTFTWELFAAHYIEMVKNRAYNRDGLFNEKEQKAAWYTLHYVLKNVLLTLAPIIPFLTDYIYTNLYDKETIHWERFPELPAEWEKYTPSITRALTAYNSSIWKAKKQQAKPLSAPIEKANLPEILLPFSMDLKAMHKIKELTKGPDEIKTHKSAIKLEYMEAKDSHEYFIVLSDS